MRKIFCCLLLIFSTSLFSEPFVVGRLSGGQLGNQCFQIATALAYAYDHDLEPYFPDLKNLQERDIPMNYRFIFWRLNAEAPPGEIEDFYEEPHFHYAPIPESENIALSGFYQSEKYFKHHKDKILPFFEPSDSLKTHIERKFSLVLEHPCTVAVHIRTLFLHDSQGLNYFRKAICLFPEESLIVIFSDNIPWCKENLINIPRKLVFIQGQPHYIDFYLMSMCKHHIISNSTFSWWAAYINKHPTKVVIAPPEWFTPGWGHGLDSKDVIPEDWIVLPL